MNPSFWGLVVGSGTSANCPISNLYAITGIDYAVGFIIGVWVLTVATVGADRVQAGVESVGWVTTLTLYLLHACDVQLLL